MGKDEFEVFNQPFMERHNIVDVEAVGGERPHCLGFSIVLHGNHVQILEERQDLAKSGVVAHPCEIKQIKINNLKKNNHEAINSE